MPDPFIIIYSPFLPHCVVWYLLALKVVSSWKITVVFSLCSRTVGLHQKEKLFVQLESVLDLYVGIQLYTYCVWNLCEQLSLMTIKVHALWLWQRLKSKVSTDVFRGKPGSRQEFERRSPFTHWQKSPHVRFGWPFTFALAQMYSVAFLLSDSDDHNIPWSPLIAPLFILVYLPFSVNFVRQCLMVCSDLPIIIEAYSAAMVWVKLKSFSRWKQRKSDKVILSS